MITEFLIFLLCEFFIYFLLIQDDWLRRHGDEEENEIIITGFDADSEGSDSESKEVTVDCVDCPEPGTSAQFLVTIVPDIEITPPNHNQSVMETKTMEIIESFPERDRNGNLNDSFQDAPNFGSPTIVNTVLKRPRNKDFSKFNRSNRKSKNCATFYYKHVDTDSEQNNLNAVVGEEDNFVSSEATSEEETWDYTNANAMEMNEEDFNGNVLVEEEEEEEDGPKTLTIRRLDFGEDEVEQKVPEFNGIQEMETKTTVVSCTKVSFIFFFSGN